MVYKCQCGTRASYGYEDKKPINCSKHKKEDMRDVVNRMCKKEDCKVRASN